LKPMNDQERLKWLQRLGERYDPRQRGKILQLLLTLAFAEVGFRVEDVGLVEGLDFVIAHRQLLDERYAFEVRTSEQASVPIKSEDLQSLDERARAGYQTGIAALRVAPGVKWILVKRSWLQLPSLRVSIGTSNGWEILAVNVNQAFDQMLEKWGEVSVDHGMSGLDGPINNARNQ
jgi:hypothetical protein